MQTSLFEEFESKEELGPSDRALLAAARAGSVAEIERLLEGEASLEARHPESGRSAVGVAVYYHRHEALTALLSAGANPDAVDGQGKTPLMDAARERCEECMGALLRFGANVEAEDSEGFFPLFIGAEHPQPAHSEMCVKTLLAAGANPNHQSPPGYFALASAACAGRVKDMEALLSAGAEVNMADPQGFTALHFAIEFKRAQAVARLLSAGADVSLRARRRGEELDAMAYAERAGDGEVAAMIYAFKELQELREDFPGLGRFMREKPARLAL